MTSFFSSLPGALYDTSEARIFSFIFRRSETARFLSYIASSTISPVSSSGPSMNLPPYEAPEKTPKVIPPKSRSAGRLSLYPERSFGSVVTSAKVSGYVTEVSETVLPVSPHPEISGSAIAAARNRESNFLIIDI